MEIVNQLTTLKNQYPNITVALGTFDGIHVGHQKVISRSADLAGKIAGTSVVFTFSNHPLSILAPERCPLQIITQEEKAELIKKLGVDILLNIPFTTSLLQLSAAQFVDLLLEHLSPKYILIGPNFFFGHNRSGTPEFLQQAGLRHGFITEINPTVYVNDVMVSSTLIRQFIAEGRVDQAAAFLGRIVTMTGKVIHGAKRGRLLGYPTINLGIEPGLVIPQDGVYAVKLMIRNQQYNGIANIGTNPTFNDSGRRIEVHILNFSGELYDEMVRVFFLKYIRKEATFSGPEELKRQIVKDLACAQDYY